MVGEAAGGGSWTSEIVAAGGVTRRSLLASTASGDGGAFWMSGSPSSNLAMASMTWSSPSTDGTKARPRKSLQLSNILGKRNLVLSLGDELIDWTNLKTPSLRHHASYGAVPGLHPQNITTHIRDTDFSNPCGVVSNEFLVCTMFLSTKE